MKDGVSTVVIKIMFEESIFSLLLLVNVVEIEKNRCSMITFHSKY